jgi:hypothetical protein
MVAGSSPNEVNFFFNLPNTSHRTVALGSTQRLTQMSTRNLPGSVWVGKGRPALRAENLNLHLLADCLDKMWEPQNLTTL